MGSASRRLRLSSTCFGWFWLLWVTLGLQVGRHYAHKFCVCGNRILRDGHGVRRRAREARVVKLVAHSKHTLHTFPQGRKQVHPIFEQPFLVGFLGSLLLRWESCVFTPLWGRHDDSETRIKERSMKITASLNFLISISFVDCCC
ncbi:hypothetical protein B0H34DRAFT_710438 [Crassisporium funariophilum]|nr:hypothetical protein B0H34DRAFT_710438 [Crassisporium funariophilum]